MENPIANNGLPNAARKRLSQGKRFTGGARQVALGVKAGRLRH